MERNMKMEELRPSETVSFKEHIASPNEIKILWVTKEEKLNIGRQLAFCVYVCSRAGNINAWIRHWKKSEKENEECNDI